MMNCSWIPVSKGADKICHFLAGAIIAIAVTLISAPLWGLSVAVGAGLIKEIWDYETYGKFNFFDFFATTLGAVLGVMALHLVLVFT